MSICIILEEDEAKVVKNSLKESMVASLGRDSRFDTLAKVYVDITKETKRQEKLAAKEIEDDNF